MISKTRSFRDHRNPIGVLILLAAFAAAAGCSTAESPNGTNINHVLPSGNSVDGWLATPSGGTHAGTATQDYIAGNGKSGCTQCHGSDLSGGTSNVSCFGNTANCHHGPVAGWVAVAPAAQNHGESAKKAPGSSGFVSCQICHGADFRTVRGGKTCFTCHTLTPHASQWRTGDTYVHTTTDPGNASVCALCHLNGANSPIAAPSPPAAAGTAPGCFNSTLCHGQAGHPAGWVAAPSSAPQPHGTAAKAANGYPGCQTCHGAGLTGSASSGNVSCFQATWSGFNCHNGGAAASWPHPPPQWRASAGTAHTHTTTDNTGSPGNPSVCAQCHRNANPGTPGCFNNTLCHGQAGHPAGWVAAPSSEPQPHGTAAKAANGYPGCQTCHGAGLTGTASSGNVSCFQATWSGFNCHNGGAAASWPHPPPQWRASAGTAHTHTTTDNTGSPGNPSVCANCHRNANPGTPGCFNNTLCHGEVGHAVPFNTTVHYSVTSGTFAGSCGACHDVPAPSAKAGPVCQTCHVAGNPVASPPLASCTSCHANPPNSASTAAYPNVAGAHSKHLALASLGNTITCDTCHSGYGTGTAEHYKRAYNRAGGMYPVRTEPGDVAFVAPFPYTIGTATFDNALATLTCGSVSCHGAQTTPGWRSTTGATCTTCHKRSGTSVNGAPATYYNDYTETWFLHNFHLGETGGSCDPCHGMTASSHFGSLGDKSIANRAAAGTILPSLNYPTNPPPSEAAMSSCNTGCH